MQDNCHIIKFPVTRNLTIGIQLKSFKILRTDHKKLLGTQLKVSKFIKNLKHN